MVREMANSEFILINSNYALYSPYPEKNCDNDYNDYKVYIISKDLIEKELTKDEYLKIKPMSDRHILDKGSH